MKFGGMTLPSLVDYPNNIVATIFCLGCNLSCPYCHNWEIASGKSPEVNGLEIFATLIDKCDWLDGFVISGGEPTIHDDLCDYVGFLRDTFPDHLIKLDTNGLNFSNLRRVLPYLDYVAMDIKTSPERYPMLGASPDVDLQSSINLIMDEGMDYEFRSTAVPPLIDDDILPIIGNMISGAKKYVIQQYNPKFVRDQYWSLLVPYKKKDLLNFKEIMEEYVDEVEIYG